MGAIIKGTLLGGAIGWVRRILTKNDLQKLSLFDAYYFMFLPRDGLFSISLYKTIIPVVTKDKHPCRKELTEKGVMKQWEKDSYAYALCFYL